ncbi:MAG: DNA polymerase III subunit alpha [Gammaproteobacteria bacterium]|nr:MAG: DNA polymerase III subunit alpha [Gammaproteobacteria bacterium]
MNIEFAHLHIHSEYSLVDGLCRVNQLIAKTAEYGMSALAITDFSNMFAMVKFYQASIKAGVKPIIGVECLIEDEENPSKPSRLVLLSCNERGYRNLSRLVSRSYLEGQQRNAPVISRNWFKESTQGLIALSGGFQGDIGRALLNGKHDLACQRVEFWKRLFPDSYYMEISRTGRAGEEDYLHDATQLANSFHIPVVATNDVRFIEKEDYEAHEARVCISEGYVLSDTRRQRNYTMQQYLRTPQEMSELFEDIPAALENSVEITKRCTLELKLHGNYLPDFPVPKGQTLDNFLDTQAKTGLDRRLSAYIEIKKESRREYDERLNMELGVIKRMGYSGYFLIVSDFIQWAKDNDIPVGPGRGSGAGSLVAWSLGITDLDPIRYELLFERFLNPERVSMPDFDIDFCMEGRDRVIDYVAERYGRDHVSQIITYGSMSAKAVVRDVARVLGYSYSVGDRIAKLIPFEIGISLDKALEDKELKQEYDSDEEVRSVIDLAKQLEGLARNAGKHAGGVVIAPTQLTDFTPLYCEQGGGGLVTQFDKSDIEMVGLVKFDFLGLRTLTIIDRAVKSINNRQNGQTINITTIPLDDPKAFELLKRCETTAVFQLESRGMKDLIKRLQPDGFHEIIALVALFRPGPLQSGMVDDFINRKHGRAEVRYPHPSLERILSPTYGVILYQEQVMQIAQVLSGYTLGEADLLRRAMGKKLPKEMAKQRAVFVNGAEKNSVNPRLAGDIFELIEKFAGYGFNKSHSAAYAMLAYQTAWLKARYPSDFMAAVLSADMDNTDKIVMLVDECRRMGLTILPPDINQSSFRFTVHGEHEIMYGLGAIKGVGQAAIDIMVQARDSEGPYKNLLDFAKRLDMQKVNRRVVEALIRSGAMDCIDSNRAGQIENLNRVLQAADKHTRDRNMGQDDLFLVKDASQAGNIDFDWIDTKPWSDLQRLQGERDTLGIYLTGHPVTQYEHDIQQITTHRLSEIEALLSETGYINIYAASGVKAIIAGLVVSIQKRNSRRGSMAFVTLDDRSGRLEVRLFGDVYMEYRHLVSKDRLIVVEGTLAYDDFSGSMRLTANKLWDIDDARAHYARCLRLTMDISKLDNAFMLHLRELIKSRHKGDCPVVIEYHNKGAQAPVWLGRAWHIRPSEEFLEALRGLLGPDNVKLEFPSAATVH